MFFYLGSALASSVVGAALDSSLSISAIIWWMTGLTVIPMALWTLSVVRANQKAGIKVSVLCWSLVPYIDL